MRHRQDPDCPLASDVATCEQDLVPVDLLGLRNPCAAADAKHEVLPPLVSGDECSAAREEEAEEEMRPALPARQADANDAMEMVNEAEMLMQEGDLDAALVMVQRAQAQGAVVMQEEEDGAEVASVDDEEADSPAGSRDEEEEDVPENVVHMPSHQG